MDGVRADNTHLEQVKPVLKTRCYARHGSLKQSAGGHLEKVTVERKVKPVLLPQHEV